MTTVKPVQTTTYYLNNGNNPITFGTGTDINVSSGSGIGVYGSNAHSWAVTNQGAISGALYGVDLAGGGSVTNQAGATISGGHSGLHVYQGYGYTFGVPFADGGGVRILGGAGTVTNAGKINGAAFGVDLAAGGSVTNEAGATISAPLIHGVYSYYWSAGVGILVAGGAGTVTNAGAITDFSGGVVLQGGGSVTNEAGATISPGGYGGGDGIDVAGGVGTVTNAGDISGFGAGVQLEAGGSVTNKAGGTISGSNGVVLNRGGSVTNEAGGTIVSYVWGLKLYGFSTVTNAGVVNGSGGNHTANGVTFFGGGSLVNEAGGTISGGSAFGGYGVLAVPQVTVTNAGAITGHQAVWLEGGGSVTNRGTGAISGSNFGVAFSDGGLVANQAGGTISGYTVGIADNGAATIVNAGDISGEAGVFAIGSAATLTNSGAIVGTKVGSSFFFGPITLGDGVFMRGGGTVANNVGGTITGAADGVYIAGGGAVTNAGAISGTTASVQFAGAGSNTLTLETGSTLTGDAIGSTASGATNALVLQGHGTADNDFDNFNTLNVQANGNWTLGGDSTFGATTVSSGSLIVGGDVGSGATVLGDPAGDLAQLVIASTGAWDLLGDSGISLGGAVPSLIKNSGLIDKTSGTGTSAIAPRLVNSGSVLVSSGALDFEGAVSGNGTETISGASTLQFDSTVGGGQTAGFTGGGALDLIDPLGFAAKISGFAATDKVELSGDWAFSGFSETGNGMMGTLTLSSGANQLALHFLGDYRASDFTIASGATTTIGHS